MSRTFATKRITRRRFLGAASVAAGSIASATAAVVQGPVGSGAAVPFLAMGAKAGEVTSNSARVWIRLTAAPTRNRGGVVIGGKVGETGPRPVRVSVDQLEGACPGMPGRARIRVETTPDLEESPPSDWAEVGAETDFTHQFELKDLKPGSWHHYEIETAAPGVGSGHRRFRGRFQTAPAADAPAEVLFCVVTCMGYADRGHPDGHPVLPAIVRLSPQFVVFTGDNVYYDSDEPRALTPALARYHWHRMFSLPRHIALLREVAAYFQKDDHDTLGNDCFPGRVMGALTFEEGQRIFREQTPMGTSSYRTIRWGRDLQIWLTETRDFRSATAIPDGPQKTIWGPRQKEWFKRTVASSDATWKVLINPNPIVGPDRAARNDNHSNSGFRTEGDELRTWIQAHAPDNLLVLCGDKHFQYHSVHPDTGLHEFGCGPASDEHAGSSPGEDPRYHKFHRVRGGFLSVRVERRPRHAAIVLRHHNLIGGSVYGWQRTLPLPG